MQAEIQERNRKVERLTFLKILGVVNVTKCRGIPECVYVLDRTASSLLYNFKQK